jgi:hypothetical protein
VIVHCANDSREFYEPRITKVLYGSIVYRQLIGTQHEANYFNVEKSVKAKLRFLPKLRAMKAYWESMSIFSTPIPDGIEVCKRVCNDHSFAY